MSSLLIEQIDNAGLVKNGEVNHEAMSKLTAFDIIEFANQAVELTSVNELPSAKDLFAHSASLSLGGGRWPCAELGCRLDRAYQLAQFAAFYSDKVYVHNFIGNYLRHLDSEEYPDEDRMSFNFMMDISVLQFLRPLIESELIVPISTDIFCPHCFVERVLKQENDKRLVKGLKNLAKRYETELAYSIRVKEPGSFDWIMRGPEDLLEHGYQAMVTTDPPPFLDKMPRLAKRIRRGEEVIIRPYLVRALELDITLADRVFQNAVFSLVTSQCLGASFVTERELDISFINSISCDPNIDRRNQMVREHLTCLVPLVKNVALSDVLKIREHEQEAFIHFRQVLSKAVNESLSSTGELTPRIARGIYQDIIRPKLAILDQRVKKAQRKLVKGTVFKAASWTAAIAFGLYTGILPESLVKAAAALGMTKVLADTIEGVLGEANSEEDIQTSDMYFLWKVKQQKEKKVSGSMPTTGSLPPA